MRTFVLQNRLSEMRPRLQSGTILLPFKEGIYVRNDNHSTLVRIEDADELAYALTRLLTGNFTVAEICGAMQTWAKEEITGLINFLYQNGFVTHVIDDARDDVLNTVGAYFDTQIKFLSHCTSRPWAAFRDFRNTRLLIAGSGISFRTCAITLLRSGLERLSILPIDSNQAQDDLGEVLRVADSIRTQGVSAQVSILNTGREALLDEYDIVVCCMDLPYLRDLLDLERRSARLGLPFYPSVIVGNCGFMGPMMKPDSAGCWGCCILRLEADFIAPTLRGSFRRNYFQLNLPFGPEFIPCDKVARIIGAEAAFEVFKAQAGDFRPETRNCIQVYTADEQGSIRVELLPHPPDSCIGKCNFPETRQVEYRTATRKAG